VILICLQKGAPLQVQFYAFLFSHPTDLVLVFHHIGFSSLFTRSLPVTRIWQRCFPSVVRFLGWGSPWGAARRFPLCVVDIRHTALVPANPPCHLGPTAFAFVVAARGGCSEADGNSSKASINLRNLLCSAFLGN